MLIRISFGLSLMLIGVAHYRDPVGFVKFVSMGFESWSWLMSLAVMWGYVLPLLLIVGGASMALGLCTTVGVWAAGLALGSIPVGLMLKMALGVSSPDVMQGAMNAFLWIFIFHIAAKSISCCGSKCAMPAPTAKVAKPAAKKAASKKS